MIIFASPNPKHWRIPNLVKSITILPLFLTEFLHFKFILFIWKRESRQFHGRIRHCSWHWRTHQWVTFSSFCKTFWAPCIVLILCLFLSILILLFPLPSLPSFIHRKPSKVFFRYCQQMVCPEFPQPALMEASGFSKKTWNRSRDVRGWGVGSEVLWEALNMSSFIKG